MREIHARGSDMEVESHLHGESNSVKEMLVTMTKASFQRLDQIEARTSALEGTRKSKRQKRHQTPGGSDGDDE